MPYGPSVSNPVTLTVEVFEEVLQELQVLHPTALDKFLNSQVLMAWQQCMGRHVGW
jgi:hypothetical protein